MLDRTPNHICKNRRCTKGADGGPLHYWACNDCDKVNSWKAAACSEACYTEYLEDIAVSRGQRVVEPDPNQLSLFGKSGISVVITEPVIPEPIVPDVVKPDAPTTFTGYYSKKKKHH